MKHTYTSDKGLAMIFNLLTHMVETGNLKSEEVDRIMNAYITTQKTKPDQMLPDKNVVDTLLNYSKSVDVIKLPEQQPVIFIRN